MLIKSPAKINLTLDVQAKLPSGYHQLSTIMAKLPLEDELDFMIWEEEAIILEGDSQVTRKKEDNLIYRAGRLLQEVSGVKTGFVCRMKKVIPSKAGLGGGSGNAAATLLALNQLWKLDLTEKELLKLAQKLGSDVPFFINPAQVILEPNHGNLDEEPKQYVLPNLPKMWLLLIKPRFSISTVKAFELLDEQQEFFEANQTSELLIGQGLKTQDVNLIAQGVSNDFQASLFERRPIYRSIANLMEKSAALNTTLTGSGSAVYVFFEQERQASRAQKELLNRHKTLKTFLLAVGGGRG